MFCGSLVDGKMRLVKSIITRKCSVSSVCCIQCGFVTLSIIYSYKIRTARTAHSPNVLLRSIHVSRYFAFVILTPFNYDTMQQQIVWIYITLLPHLHFRFGNVIIGLQMMLKIFCIVVRHQIGFLEGLYITLCHYFIA